jgi:DNA polymerase-1
MKMLVDGDIVVYRCAFAAEHARYVIVDEETNVPVSPVFQSAAERNAWLSENEWAKELAVHTYKDYEPVSHALANVKNTLSRIAKVGDLHGIFLSKGECFRHSIATMLKYKGNRDDAPRPRYYDDVREYLIKHYGALVFTTIEADDALAMCQKEDTAIASIDKDLLQVPGNHYNWVHDANENMDTDGKVHISKEVGLRKLMMQVLTGDSTDNIPGIKGIGEVKARKYLSDVDDNFLRQTCLEIWQKYLASDRPKPIDSMDYDAAAAEVKYIPWNEDDVVCTSVENIMREVYRLVKVGGNDAEKAAHQAGEEILLPR